MIFLERTYMYALAGKLCLDSLSGSSCSGYGGDIRNVMLDRILTDVAVADIVLLG
jgi:hypothetical protein